MHGLLTRTAPAVRVARLLPLSTSGLLSVGRYGIAAAAVACAYWAAGRVSLAAAYEGPVAAVWLATGVGAAALYGTGWRYLPALVLADLALGDTTQAVPTRVFLTAGNVADVVVITLLMRHLLGLRPRPLRVGGVASLLIAVAAGAAVTSAVAFAAQSGQLEHADAAWDFFRSWWLADVAGSLVVLPLVLAWSARRAPIGRSWEWGALLAVVVALSAVSLLRDLPVTYLVFPALIWAALRFGQRGATLAVAVAAGTAVAITAREHGAFVSQSIGDGTLATQVYVIVAALTALYLATSAEERRSATHELAAAEHLAARRAADERLRIARDLHDSLSQSLFTAGLHALQAERALGGGRDAAPGRAGVALGRTRELLANAQAELHAFVFELRPEAMREDGLVEALTRHAAGVAAREQLRVSVRGPDERLPLTPATEEQLYRLCQEALANAVRHARASEVRIRISLRDRLLIVIRDDGRGFDPSIVRPGGFGLRSMRSRAAELGGSVQIRSHPGDGTVVLVEIPMMVAGDG